MAVRSSERSSCSSFGDATTRCGSWSWAGSVNMPWWLVPSSPTSPARSTAMSTGWSFWHTSWTVWSNARWRNVEYSATTGRIPPSASPVANVIECCSAMPDVEEAVRELGLELRQAGAGRHAGGDPDDPPVRARQLDQLGHEDRRVVRGLRLGPRQGRRRGGVVGHRLGRHLPVGPRAVVGVGARVEGHRRQGRAVEADLVGLGRLVAAALLGADVDDRRPGQRQRAPQRAEERAEVVPRHDADVGDPEILEQLAGLGEVDDRLAEPPAQLEHGGSDDRDALDGPVVGALALAPRPRQLDLREVLGERADGRADRHLVVVEHDQQLGLALADVVERLERQAAHQRRVADDDRDPLQSVPHVARLGQALGDGQAGAGVAAVEHVMDRFAAAREPPDAVDLAERPEPVEAAGQQLVRIGLVAGVPDDPVTRRLEQAVERRASARRRRATSRGVRRYWRRSR